jgi:hypothetical protein
MRHQSGISVAQMQLSGRTWCKAGVRLHKKLDPDSLLMVS